MAVALRHVAILPLALAAATAAAAVPELGEWWPDVDTPVDEEQLLHLESTSAEFAGGDTSLLQVRVQLPAAAGDVPEPIQQGLWEPRAHPLYDIPESAWAWALWQAVGDGPPRPELLANDTTWEPPGDTFPNQTAVMAERIREVGGKTYVSPTHPGPTSPDWLYMCMGNDFDINNYTSWVSIGVATPQLVPFVVPVDQPNRSDVSIVVVPGGGGDFLAWESEGTDVAKWLNTLGISAFVLKHRTPDSTLWNRAAAVMDAQRAVSLVRHMAPSLGLNASRVGIFGASHGGFVSLFTTFAAGRQYPRRDAVDDASEKPDFAVLLYPEVQSVLYDYLSKTDKPTTEIFGVTLTDLRNPPPIFIATGANDKCCKVESMYTFHSALLRRTPDPVMEMHIFSDVRHGFSMCYRSDKGGWSASQKAACLWMLRAREFIRYFVEREAVDGARTWYNVTTHFDGPP